MAGVSTPWLAVSPLTEVDFATLRRRAIFDCQKWDPQVGDVCVIARAPLVVRRDAWAEVERLASALAREALAAEAELVLRPELHARLGLPRAVRRALRRAAETGPTPGVARLIRFDFHHAPEGWRISEANADVPGGLNEASGFPALFAPHYPWAAPVGDAAGAYVEAIAGAAGAGGTVALVHATAYSDDQQMMAFMAKRLEAAGIRTHLASPAHLRWERGRARLDAGWWRGPLDVVLRFFPGDWLPLLPQECGWPQLFSGGTTPLSNPPTALLVQSKRFPLVWDALTTPLPTWRALLPETRDPREAPWRADDGWILKPAFGRAGEGVTLRGLVDPADWRRSRRAARWFPRYWAAQRRFEAVPVEIGGAEMYPCLGVYTLGERVVGAYGRLARRPLIDARAEETAVFTAA
jgi:glutathionylspermidine synthase